jgi:hypothetical protein
MTVWQLMWVLLHVDGGQYAGADVDGQTPTAV